MKTSWIAIALFVGLATGQDAGQVLATSVSYRTLRASANLTTEQQSEADRLGQLAAAAGRERKFPDAMKHYLHDMAVMRGVEWTPLTAFAASVELKPAHAMWEPGQTVRFTLRQTFSPDTAPEQPVAATAKLLRLGGTGESVILKKWDAIDPKQMPWSGEITVPKVDSGNYRVELELSGVSKTAPVHVEALAAEVSRIRSRCEALTQKEFNNSTVLSACYAVDRFLRADAGELPPSSADFPKELAASNEYLNAIESGKNPFASMHGDMRKAYRSTTDQSVQPYRLFVPTAYDGTKPFPLVVALHGMGGDENALFDRYNSNAIAFQAEKRGYLVVCPKGLAPASMYVGPAEKDVLNVLAEVQRDYRVAPARIYLMGHSMGAYGTWSIAMNHPDLFAALGPIAGGGQASGMATIKKVPQYVVHGDADKTVPVENSRTMVAAAKKADTEIKYTEVPGGSHTGVFIPAIPGMFDWFDAHRKPATGQPQ